MNAGMKNMTNVMSKFLNIGMTLPDVILRSTWNPAKEIHHEELGSLTLGSVADVSVLRVEKGKFGFTDSLGGRLEGNKKLVCELTVRDGLVVWDLNGISGSHGTSGRSFAPIPHGTVLFRPEGSLGATNSSWLGSNDTLENFTKAPTHDQVFPG